MVGHGGTSAGSYLAYPTSPIPSHCASIVATSTLRVNKEEVGKPDGLQEDQYATDRLVFNFFLSETFEDTVIGIRSQNCL